MQYLGRILGSIVGILLLGKYGIVIGFIIGHIIDRARLANGKSFFSNQQVRQTLFFRTTFQVMGHLTKAKGRVTQADIQVATAFMDRMQLHGASRLNAQQAFREGKEGNYPLKEKLRELRAICFGRSDLIRMFLEIQVQVAFADGKLHPNEREVLHIIAEGLGFSRAQFDQFLSMIEGSQSFTHSGYRQSQSGANPYQQGPNVNDAYKVLGVKPSDDAAIVKRAYRKLMNEHHPDKLVAKGLPPEMVDVAKEKAQEIQAAYDLIKQVKGFK
jgi:DnaJ like chaperone protein